MASPGIKGDDTTDPTSVELIALDLDTDVIFGHTSHFERRKAKVCLCLGYHSYFVVV